MLSIENVLYNFSAKILEVRDKDYCTRLEHLIHVFAKEKNAKIQNCIYLENSGRICGVNKAPVNKRLGRYFELLASNRKEGRPFKLCGSKASKSMDLEFLFVYVCIFP